MLSILLTGDTVDDSTQLSEPLATFMQDEPDLFVATLRQIIVNQPSFRNVVMNNLFSVPRAQQEIRGMNCKLRYGMRISRRKWQNRVSPIFSKLSNLLSGEEIKSSGRRKSDHIQLIKGRDTLEDEYRELTDIYVPTPQIAHFPDGTQVPELNAVHYPMLKLLQLQLSTPSIRRVMHFNRIQTVPRPFFDTDRVLIGEHTLTLKVCRDGFVLSMGRMLEMTIMVNCNVRGLANSKEHADIVSLATVQETDFNLYLLCQQVDKEMLLLQIFGVVDPLSGQLITLIFMNCEDSSSAEKGFGRPNSRSDGKWLWSKYGESKHILHFDTIHCPMSITAKWCTKEWNRFVHDKFQRYCDNKNVDPRNAQFEDATRFADFVQHENHYKSCLNYVKNGTKLYGFTRGQWNRAVDHRQSPVDPLHQGMRNIVLTGKHSGLGLMGYHLYVMADEQDALRRSNHCDHDGRRCRASNPKCADYMKKMSQQQILHHFQEHGHLDLRYDKDEPGRSRVRARMFFCQHLIVAVHWKSACCHRIPRWQQTAQIH